MKIAICIISVGNYNKFLIPLLDSIDRLMLVEYKKTIFLFSDIDYKRENVKVTFSEYLPCPLVTLLRFKNIIGIKDQLKHFNLIYYIDVDCLVISNLSYDILPVKIGQMVATEHPWGKSEIDSYERNDKSLAYINKNITISHPYYQGCFFGGYSKDFIDMAIELDNNIRTDLKNRIIAKWYDESHMNKYLIYHPPKVLHGGYAFPDPERWKDNFKVDCKIIHYNYHDN